MVDKRAKKGKKIGSNNNSSNFQAAKYSQFIALNRFSLDFWQIFPPIWGLCVHFLLLFGYG